MVSSVAGPEIERLIQLLARLPGLGPRSARRAALHLIKKREALMTPIQEEIYNAVKEIADLRGYSLVLDRASNAGIIFGSPKIDISNEVLQKLGYSNN